MAAESDKKSHFLPFTTVKPIRFCGIAVLAGQTQISLVSLGKSAKTSYGQGAAGSQC